MTLHPCPACGKLRKQAGQLICAPCRVQAEREDEAAVPGLAVEGGVTSMRAGPPVEVLPDAAPDPCDAEVNLSEIETLAAGIFERAAAELLSGTHRDMPELLRAADILEAQACAVAERFCRARERRRKGADR